MEEVKRVFWGVMVLIGAVVGIAGLVDLFWEVDLDVLGWGLSVWLVLSGGFWGWVSWGKFRKLLGI